MYLANSFSRMFFIIYKGSIRMGISYTFIGNYSVLDYFNILLILVVELNSEFKDFKLGAETVIQRICLRHS